MRSNGPQFIWGPLSCGHYYQVTITVEPQHNWLTPWANGWTITSMDAITGLLYATLGALRDGLPVRDDLVLKFAAEMITAEQVAAGADLYEDLVDIEQA